MQNKVLIIDDSHFFRIHLGRLLLAEGYETLTACSGEEGMDLVCSQRPDLLLLDVDLPGVSGYDVCRLLRKDWRNDLMPILMLSSKDRRDDVVQGLRLGADDYICKPFYGPELLGRVRNTLRRIQCNRDVNPLSGLRGNLEIAREIERRICREIPSAVIYIDLDNFKEVNDRYGFFVGDDIIRLTAELLQQVVETYGGDEDFIGHIGGDDFVFITEPKRAKKMCRQFIRLFDVQSVSLLEKVVPTGAGGPVIPTVSMAVVDSRNCATPPEVAASAAGLKETLKGMSGSNFLQH